jgi:hypothetical protein
MTRPRLGVKVKGQGPGDSGQANNACAQTNLWLTNFLRKVFRFKPNHTAALD